MKPKLPLFNNPELFQQALTHRSYVNENPNEKDNERLEFLGDAVLGFWVGKLLYDRYPEMSEAQLTRLRSALVNEKQLAELAENLSIGQLIRLGRGAQRDGGRENPALLSDTFEAIIGAYFLDAGIDAVRDYIYPLFSSLAEKIVRSPSDRAQTPNLVDCKNRFQQWALANHQQNPQYRIVKESGLDHAKEFTAEVLVNGEVYGTGTGHRKQIAEKRAAEDALLTLKKKGQMTKNE
ncbi:MAG TPA: ribonuclease III [Oscillatoriales cyanobacterium M4454_W2019_049]|nr:MAG: ribonuclease III [Cyanobacteria bacterium J055]HIK33592.1 ribonuclease III [Oscillatoriales cyanobacterium M4454_W2019_049]